MKKYLIISSILAFITLIVCSFILFFSVDLKNIEQEFAPYQEQYEQTIEDYSANYLIDLNLEDASVEILPADNNQIKIVTYQHNRSENIFDIQASPEKLTVKVTKGTNIDISFLNFSLENRGKIVFYLPDSMNPTIQITGESSDIYVDKIKGEKLTARVNDGYYDIQSSNFKTEIFLQSNNSSIEATLLNAPDISFLTNNGYIECTELTASDSITLKSSNGSIDTADLYARNVSLLTKNGSIELINIIDTEYEIENLRTRTQFGDVQVDALCKNRIEE